MTTVNIERTFELKGGLYTLTALKLLGSNFVELEAQLKEKILQAPRFFQNAPLVIDCTNVRERIDFIALRNLLIRNELIPIGVRGVRSELRDDVLAAAMAILTDSTPEKDIKEAPAPAAESTPLEAANKLVTTPVRSGQQIYARGGDLIIRAPVSHGAELLADGNIHVYGPLRGRALAGVTGNKDARIFCQSLEAELVSVAGQYRVSEDLKNTIWKGQCEIYLSGNHLHVGEL